MALQKEIEVGDTGAIGNYLRIGTVVAARDQKKLQVKIDIYLSKEKRDKGKHPMASIVKDFPEDIVLTGSNLFEALYDELKSDPDFAGAKDV